MSRLSEAFPKDRTALICHAMGGDPSVAATAGVLRALDDAGADVIELGLPFSDPIADGPVLQAAATRALSGGATFSALMEMIRGLKLRAPVVAMGYMNPIEALGAVRFAKALATAGLCGAIVPDLPLEEATPLRDALAAAGLDLISLVAPTTGARRAKAIASQARGFLYTVSVTGVTGAQAELPKDLAERLSELRAISKVPVAVGFGISRPEQAAALKGKADGIVVGTAIVAANQKGGPAAVAELVRSLRAAL